MPQEVEELLSLPPDKVLLKWMNFHLQRGGYDKTVRNFSSDVKVYDMWGNRCSIITEYFHCYVLFLYFGYLQSLVIKALAY